MKGKNSFTTAQVLKIKKLIAEKVISSGDKQKGIRAKIRNIGFYYSDFSSSSEGYTVADFESLIRSGQVKVTDGNYKPSTTIVRPKQVEKPKEILKQITNSKPSLTDTKTIFKEFKQNKFDPKIDNESLIADSCGNYIICLRKNSSLPKTTIKPTLTNFDELQVLYTGIAGGSLKKRDYKQHFKGNAGGSTLRKSLGVLFGYKLIPRDKDPNTGKTKFNLTDEQKLSDWMSENLIMYFLPTTNYESIELKLINEFNPPLNLKDNHNIINLDFRQLLSSLRAKKN